MVLVKGNLQLLPRWLLSANVGSFVGQWQLSAVGYYYHSVLLVHFLDYCYTLLVFCTSIIPTSDEISSNSRSILKFLFTSFFVPHFLLASRYICLFSFDTFVYFLWWNLFRSMLMCSAFNFFLYCRFDRCCMWECQAITSTVKCYTWSTFLLFLLMRV